MESKVISARVPIDVAEMFEKSRKIKGLTKSKYMVELMSTPSLPTYKVGGQILSTEEMPDELSEVLSAVGGIAIGTMIYKLLIVYLPKDRFTAEEIKGYAMIGGVACGLASAYGINKMINPEQ